VAPDAPSLAAVTTPLITTTAFFPPVTLPKLLLILLRAALIVSPLHSAVAEGLSLFGASDTYQLTRPELSDGGFSDGGFDDGGFDDGGFSAKLESQDPAITKTHTNTTPDTSFKICLLMFISASINRKYFLYLKVN
jgi:hypothetical protein